MSYAFIQGSVGFVSCKPLFFELALMISHPLPEGLVGAFLTGLHNLTYVVFLFIMMAQDEWFHHLSYKWTTYVLVGSSLISALLIAAVRAPDDYVAKSMAQQRQQQQQQQQSGGEDNPSSEKTAIVVVAAAPETPL